MEQFIVLSFDEMQEIDGGKGLKWLPFLQPAYDFLCGVGSGFMGALKKDK